MVYTIVAAESTELPDKTLILAYNASATQCSSSLRENLNWVPGLLNIKTR